MRKKRWRAGPEDPGGKNGQETETEGTEQAGQKPSSVRPEIGQPHGSGVGAPEPS